NRPRHGERPGRHQLPPRVAALDQLPADPQIAPGEPGGQDQRGHRARPGRRLPVEHGQEQADAGEQPQEHGHGRQHPPRLAARPLDVVHYFARSTSVSLTLAPVRRTARSYTLAPRDRTASTASTMSAPDPRTCHSGTSVAAIRTGITIEENGGMQETTVATVPVGSVVA